jgi:hypothetical protein
MHWYLVTNLAAHLDLAGYIFLDASLILNAPLNLSQNCIFILSWRKPEFKYIVLALGLNTHAPNRKLMLYHWAMDARHIRVLVLYI